MPTIHTTTVKMVAETADTFTVAGYGVCWGGRDISGEAFSPDTDFWFDRITETPMVLYRHGLDGKMVGTVVGQVCTKTADDYGLWIEAQIKEHEDYSDAIRALVKKGVLGWSSGAVSHLISKVKKGGVTNITSWPIAEWSLVPDPCEPRTLGVSELDDMAKTAPAFKSVVDAVKGLEEGSDSAGGVLVPEDSGKASMTAAQRKKLPDSSFAYVDSDGNRHLPINDADHVRAALSRFNQTQFESPKAKATAKRKIMAAAKRLGVDASGGKSADSKALPDGPTLMGDDDGGPYPEGSYEDLADDIAQALRKQTGEYAYVIATFPDYALVRCCGDDADTDDQYGMPDLDYFRVAYTLDAEGEPVLGDMEEVEPAMIPSSGKSAALPVLQTDEAPLAVQSARLADYAALLTTRTQDVSERRIKEGRVLSTANRERLTSTADALEGSLKSLRDLLAITTEPAVAEVTVVDRMAHLNRELEGLQLWASVSLPG